MIFEISVPANQTTLMTANEAASVTGVPLRQVHRIIDAGLLGGAVRQRDKVRLLAQKAFVGLRLAHETADVLTLQSRRAVVATSIRSPRQSMIRTDMVVVDARPAARAVRSGLSQLPKPRGIVSSTPDVLGGTPVFKGTRIPVHDIAICWPTAIGRRRSSRPFRNSMRTVFASQRFMRWPIRREAARGRNRAVHEFARLRRPWLSTTSRAREIPSRRMLESGPRRDRAGSRPWGINACHLDWAALAQGLGDRAPGDCRWLCARHQQHHGFHDAAP